MRNSQPTRPQPAKRPPPRVRYEPPTIEEAVSAARDLSSDASTQIEIAAGLMGISEDEVRPYVQRLSVVRPAATIVAGRRAVVVERKVTRRVAR